MPLSGFGIKVMVASLNEFESILSSLYFWKSLRKIGTSTLYVQEVNLFY
jgi:hypothetical protein